MTVCPTCGQPTDGIERPLHDVARQEVTFNGKTAHIGWAGNLILSIFLNRHPNTVHRDVILAAVWGGRDVAADNNFRVQICRLRKALEPLGIRIVTQLGGSAFPGFYWLEWD